MWGLFPDSHFSCPQDAPAGLPGLPLKTKVQSEGQGRNRCLEKLVPRACVCPVHPRAGAEPLLIPVASCGDVRCDSLTRESCTQSPLEPLGASLEKGEDSPFMNTVSLCCDLNIMFDLRSKTEALKRDRQFRLGRFISGMREASIRAVPEQGVGEEGEGGCRGWAPSPLVPVCCSCCRAASHPC